MLSLDTNLLFTAANPLDSAHLAARQILQSWSSRADVVISELVLAEFYGLLRNPKINTKPLSAPQAVSMIQAYRQHPNWKLVGFPTDAQKCHDAIWLKAAEPSLGFRRFYDLRLAYSLLYCNVDEFATINVKDFKNLGFRKVWNPLA
jgi:predicted nucleic acid-binding protein